MKSHAPEFDQWSKSYEKGLFSRHFVDVNRRIVAMCRDEITRSNAMLNIGCGTGLLEEIVAKEVRDDATFTSVDSSSEMQKKMEAKNIPGNHELVNATMDEFVRSRIATDQGRYDIAFCINAFHHVENHRDIFANLATLLNRGGYFVIYDAVADGLLRRGWIKLCKWICNEPDVEYHTSDEFQRLADPDFMLDRSEWMWHFGRAFCFKRV